MEYLLRDLEAYNLTKFVKKNVQKEVIKSAKIFLQRRNLIVYAFEENIFPLPKQEMPQHEEQTKEKIGK